MKKIFKIIAVIVGIAVLLIAAAAIALPFFFDPNDYKDRITAAVHDKTGRELIIGGDIGLSVFPWLGVRIESVQLSNAQGFGDRPMVKVAEAAVRVKLMPLLRKEVEMDTVTLEGAEVHLARDKGGRSNWADLTGTPAAQPAPSAPEAAAPALAALTIGGVRIKDSTVVWDDQTTGNRYQLAQVNLNTGHLTPGAPFDLDLAFDFARGEDLAGHVELDGKVNADPGRKQYRVDGVDLDVRVDRGIGEGAPVAARLRTDLAVDLEKQTLTAGGLKLTALGLDVSGDLTGSAIVDKPQFRGSLKVAEFSPRDLIETLRPEPLVTADAAALGKASAGFDLEATTDSAKLNKLTLRLDDTTATGNLAVRSFASPAVNFDLAVDQIDVDRYLPPAPDEPQGATPATAAAAGAGALPVELLRGLRMDGTLRIEKMKAYNLRTAQLRLTVSARDGLVRVHPASAQMYDGAYNGDVSLDVRKATPQISVNEQFDGVQIAPLLKDLNGSEKLSGKASFFARLTAAGADVEAMRANLNGNLGFTFADGALKGVNIGKLIRDAKAALRGQPAARDGEDNQTDFTELKGTATVSNGVVQNDDFEGKSPLLRVNGAGTANLVTQALDYRLKVVVVETRTGQGGKELEELRGVAIPLRVGGTFAQPKYSVDVQAALAEKAKEKVQEKVEEKKEEIQKKIEDKIQDKLKGLLR